MPLNATDQDGDINMFIHASSDEWSSPSNTPPMFKSSIGVNVYPSSGQLSQSNTHEHAFDYSSIAQPMQELRSLVTDLQLDDTEQVADLFARLQHNFCHFSRLYLAIFKTIAAFYLVIFTTLTIAAFTVIRNSEFLSRTIAAALGFQKHRCGQVYIMLSIVVGIVLLLSYVLRSFLTILMLSSFLICFHALVTRAPKSRAVTSYLISP